jgi:hypothetical protein
VRTRSGAALASVAAAVAIACGSLAASPASAAPAAKVPRAAATPAKAPFPYHVAVRSGYIHTAGRTASPGIPGAASTTSIPIYYITPTNYGYLSGIHACLPLGNDGTNQAVECADLWAGPDPTPGLVDVYPVAEGYCQNLSDHNSYPKCSFISLELELAQGNGAVGDIFGGECGASSAPCGTNRRNYFDGYVLTIGGCDPEPGTAYEFWSVVRDDSMFFLPSGHEVTSPENLASPHAIICPA